MAKEIYPPMHTAEHLLNQTMVRLFNTGRCFCAHIEKKKSKCDYHFGRDLSDAEKQQIEEQINKLIDEDLKVEEKYISLDQAGAKHDLSRLPDGVLDRVRIIDIGDYDSCPCSGPHVKSTKEIKGFWIVSSRFENNALRIIYKLT